MKGGVDPRKRHKQVFFGTFILFRNYNPWRLTWNSQIKMDDNVPFDSSGVILRWTFRRYFCLKLHPLDSSDFSPITGPIEGLGCFYRDPESL